jgi:hypothetical protein
LPRIYLGSSTRPQSPLIRMRNSPTPAPLEGAGGVGGALSAQKLIGTNSTGFSGSDRCRAPCGGNSTPHPTRPLKGGGKKVVLRVIETTLFDPMQTCRHFRRAYSVLNRTAAGLTRPRQKQLRDGLPASALVSAQKAPDFFPMANTPSTAQPPHE